MSSNRCRLGMILAVIVLAGLAATAPLAQERGAQPPAGRAAGTPAPPVISPEVLPDRSVVFRLLAPQADTVGIRGSDIPALAGGRGAPPPPPMTKQDNGVWQVTLGPLEPGAYRYTFTVNGVAVNDPRNPATSESNTNTWSLVQVPGSDLMDTRQVPHGAVASVYYYSTALKRTRRMHVYTPPGYETGRGKYPVFYLLHGAGDCDDAWTSVGRAGFIFDNLLASRKAAPMIVVMPAGHTTASTGARGAAAPAAGAAQAAPRDEFFEDFVNDIMPYVEKNYRTLNDRQHRAIAGLSMGGGQTLNIAFSHLDRFAYVGVYSSGIMGGGMGAGRGATPPGPGNAPPPPFGAAWEKARLAMLDDAKLKRGLKVLWFSTGVDDGLIVTTRNTVALLKKHGFNPVFLESKGAHTWLNWRDYLIQFTPQLFR